MTTWDTTVYGKVILTGEHLVLRGGEALVSPLKSRSMTLYWKSSDQPFTLKFQDQIPVPLHFFLNQIFEQALSRVNKKRENLNGILEFKSTIPIGSGLGSSAAICLGLARFFKMLNWITEDQIFEFARSLEDFFHGQSSGVDIVASGSIGPVIFSRKNKFRNFTPVWSPLLAIIDCGLKSSTAECLQQLDKIKNEHPQSFDQAEMAMASSFKLFQKALCPDSEKTEVSVNLHKAIDEFSLQQRAETLKLGFDQGLEAFEKWGLVADPVRVLIDKLTRAFGVTAAKPTGSGMGGYVLGFWKDAEQFQKVLNDSFLSAIEVKLL